MFRYGAFGLRIESDFSFPELPIDNQANDVDISITLSPVSENGIDNPSIKSIFFQSNEQLSWFNVPGMARFLVMSGQQIIIDPAPGAAKERLRFFVLNCCLNYLFTQRGLLVLQGHVIRVDDSAILLTGYPMPLYFHDVAIIEPINTVFLNRGYSILSNDVCVINEELFVLPSYPRMPISKSHACYLNNQLHRIEHQHMDKFFVSIEDGFCREPLPLKGIYGLACRVESTESVQPVDPLALMRHLIYAQHCYKELEYDQVFLNKLILIPFKMIYLDFNGKKRADYIDWIRTPSILYEKLNQLADSIESDIVSEHLENIS